MSQPTLSSYRNMSHLQKHFDRLMAASKSVLEIHTKAPIAPYDPEKPGNLVLEIRKRYERLKECIEGIEQMKENP